MNTRNRLLQLALQNAADSGRLQVQMNGDAAAIYLKGVISADFGVGAEDLRAGLQQAAGAPVKLYVNSPGGDVFEGREMQALIAGYGGKVTAVVQGMAASAATLLTMAASEVHITKGSRYMIHNGWTIMMGDRHVAKATLELLSSFDAELASEYAAKSGATVAQATAWMDAETWFTAEQAVENKFADQVLTNTQNAAMRAAWNLAAYSNAPQLEADPAQLQAATAEQQQRIARLNRSRLAALLHQP